VVEAVVAAEGRIAVRFIRIPICMACRMVVQIWEDYAVRVVCSAQVTGFLGCRFKIK
jgi:hypothetical protein